MNIEPLTLSGAFVIMPRRAEDERGSFERSFCAEEFTAHGLNPNVAQCSISSNHLAGTLRGLHYQKEPHAEAKLVRCQRGASFHVVVDLRESSATFCEWHGLELRADKRNALYVPEGCAHGFLTLVPETEIHYQISVPYVPDSARGVRWDDPAFSIDWPQSVNVISERDASYSAFNPRANRIG